jgi:hypothetical protein
MNDPQPFPVWIIPLFPLFFVGVWLFVVGLLAALGGWSALGRHFRDPGDAARGNFIELPGSSLMMRRAPIPFPVSYNHCVAVTVSGAGLHLRVMVLFRFRHPPLLIPWEQVERMEPGHHLFWRTLRIRLRGTGTRISLVGDAGRVVEEAWAQRAGLAMAAAPG